MRLLGKIAVILVAALVVVGGTLALERSGALDGMMGGRGEGHVEGDESAFDARELDEEHEVGEGRGRPPGGRGLHGEGGEFGEGNDFREGGPGGVFSLMGIVKNLVIVGVIVLGVWLATKLFSRIGGKKDKGGGATKVDEPEPA